MKKIIIFIIGLIIICTRSNYGAFEDMGNDARAKGMANAYYAEPAGISSMYYNPAGTSFTRKFEVIGSYALPFLGLDALSFSTFNGAVLFPLTYFSKYSKIFEDSSIAIGINNISFGYEGSEYYDDAINYYERVIVINLSKNFPDLLMKGTRFGVGVNVDILLRGLDSNEHTRKNSSYFVEGNDTSGFGIDLGLFYVLTENLRFGMVLDNFIEPDVAFNENISAEDIENNMKIGASWKSKELWRLKDVTIAAGIAFEDIKSHTWEYRLGFEFWEFKHLLGIRFGYESSDEGMDNLTMGLSGSKVFKRKHELEVNYSFIIPIGTVRDTYGTHCFSLVYRYDFLSSLSVSDSVERRKMLKMLDKQGKLISKMSNRVEPKMPDEQVSKMSNIVEDVTPPDIIALKAPKDGTNLLSDKVGFIWEQGKDSASGIDKYILEVSDNIGFIGSKIIETDIPKTTFSLRVGSHYWRVKAYDRAGNTNKYSSAWRINIQMSTMIPELLFPEHETVIDTLTPVYMWISVEGADLYWVEVRTNNINGRMISENKNIGKTGCSLGKLLEGEYIWRIRARKKGTKQWQRWSDGNRFIIEK